MELENGQKYEGDILVGADGIWSKVLLNIFNSELFLLQIISPNRNMGILRIMSIVECIGGIYEVAYSRMLRITFRRSCSHYVWCVRVHAYMCICVLASFFHLEVLNSFCHSVCEHPIWP